MFSSVISHPYPPMTKPQEHSNWLRVKQKWNNPQISVSWKYFRLVQKFIRICVFSPMCWMLNALERKKKYSPSKRRRQFAITRVNTSVNPMKNSRDFIRVLQPKIVISTKQGDQPLAVCANVIRYYCPLSSIINKIASCRFKSQVYKICKC